MAVTIDIDHDTGDLSQYTSTVTDGGDLSVTAAAALAGSSYGLQCVLDDTNLIYGVKEITKQVTVRYRIYIDPNSVTMATNDKFSIVTFQQNGGSWKNFLYLSLQYTGTSYNIEIMWRTDADAYLADDANITDAPHYIEVKQVRATTDVSADGTVQWWLDGVDQGTATGIDNYNNVYDQDWRVLVGAANVDAGTSGTVYVDELVANDDGSAIGPAGATAYTLPCAAGSYSLSGITVNLTRALKLVPEVGSYVLSGVNPALLQALKLSLAVGSYSLTGITLETPRTYQITCASGSYSLSGVTLALRWARVLACAVGSYALSGVDLNWVHGYFMTVSPGSYALTGVNLNFIRDYTLQAAIGSYVLTGLSLTFINSADFLPALRGRLAIVALNQNLLSLALEQQAAVTNVGWNTAGTSLDQHPEIRNLGWNVRET